MRRPVHQRSDHLLPIEARLNAIALQVVAAREAQEGRLHRSQLFHDVDAIAVGPALVGGWEERDHLQPECRRPVKGHLEVVLG